jgi:hypothetical protein
MLETSLRLEIRKSFDGVESGRWKVKRFRQVKGEWIKVKGNPALFLFPVPLSLFTGNLELP